MSSRIRNAAVIASTVAMLSLAGAAFAEDGEVIVFDWAGYEDPAFHPDFVTKYGDSPSFAFFGDEDEAFEKLRSGFKADIAHPCSQSIVKWRDAGLLQPLDTSKLTYWNDMLPGIKDMKDLMTTADGKAWFVPFDWGNTVVTYRTDKVQPDEIKSLKAFADPKFKDRVSLPDNVDDAYAFAALSMGIKDWTTMTEAQVEQASNFLREVHKNVRLYWTDNTELSQAMGGSEGRPP